MIEIGAFQREHIISSVVVPLQCEAGFSTTHQDRFLAGNLRSKTARLGSVLGKLRGEEKLNEDNILDSTRIRRIPYIFNSPAGFLADVENQYAKDLWENQPIHLEVFSEKDAMSSVLEKHRSVLSFSIRGLTTHSPTTTPNQSCRSRPPETSGSGQVSGPETSCHPRRPRRPRRSLTR
jgi:ferredoxin-NADP reductase